VADLTLTREEYMAFLSLSRKRATVDEVLQIEAFARNIEKRNGIVRFSLWVQWQEADSPLPSGTDFPTSWPPSLRAFIELDRGVAKSDVVAILAERARIPVTVLVTPDPAGQVGWTPIDTFFA
jgi:hypothetical protein